MASNQDSTTAVQGSRRSTRLSDRAQAAADDNEQRVVNEAPNTKRQTRRSGGQVKLEADQPRNVNASAPIMQAGGTKRKSDSHKTAADMETQAGSSMQRGRNQRELTDPSDVWAPIMQEAGEAIRRPVFAEHIWQDFPSREQFQIEAVGPHFGNAGTTYAVNAQTFWNAWLTLINDEATPNGYRSKEAFLVLQHYAMTGILDPVLTAEQVRNITPAFKAFNVPCWPQPAKFAPGGGFYYTGFNREDIVGGLNTYRAWPRQLDAAKSGRLEGSSDLNQQFPFGTGNQVDTQSPDRQDAPSPELKSPIAAPPPSDHRLDHPEPEEEEQPLQQQASTSINNQSICGPHGKQAPAHSQNSRRTSNEAII